MQTESTAAVTSPATDSTFVHPLAVFGAGPYRFVSFSCTEMRAGIQRERESNGLSFTTNLCGGSCDLCGQEIWDVYTFIAVGSMRRFVLGCDCAELVFDPTLARDRHEEREMIRIAREIAAAKRGKAHLVADAKIAVGVAFIDARASELAAIPHPTSWRAEKGETLLDSLRWTLENAGRAGKCKAVRSAYAALGVNPPRRGRGS